MAAPVRGSRKVSVPSVSVPVHDPKVMKAIAETAYALWEKRGRPHGSDLQDWVEAEQIVLGRKS